MSNFVVGQRVRVRQYKMTWDNPAWGNPHFIVGHFGHIKVIDGRYFDIQITCGPDGGPIDQRVRDEPGEIGGMVWPMLAEEIEAVD